MDNLLEALDPLSSRVDALEKRVRVLEHPPESLSPSVAHSSGRSTSKVVAETGIKQSAGIFCGRRFAPGKVVFMAMGEFVQLVRGMFLGIRRAMTPKDVRRKCASVHAYGRCMERHSTDWRI